jgi:isocitrate dehydrogenase
LKKAVNSEITKQDIYTLLNNAITENIDTIKTENLYEFDGQRRYSLVQGQ